MDISSELGKRCGYYLNDVNPMAVIWTESMLPEFEENVLAWETANLIFDSAV